MSTPSKQRAPAGLGISGRRLWKEITQHIELDAHEIVLLTEAARVTDRLDELAAKIASEGAMVAGKAHPALVEARQQQIALSRLIATLRLPEDLQNPETRPQRRGAARGSYLRAL